MLSVSWRRNIIFSYSIIIKLLQLTILRYLYLVQASSHKTIFHNMTMFHNITIFHKRIIFYSITIFHIITIFHNVTIFHNITIFPNITTIHNITIFHNMTIFHNFYLVQACSHGGGRGAACGDGWRDLWQAR